MAPFQLTSVLAQDFDDGRPGGVETAIGLVCNCFGMIVTGILLAFVIAGLWKTFVKAGKPGWASIIPIYNYIVILEIVGRPIWWILLLLIPCVELVVRLIVGVDIAKSYGKGTGFGVGLALLPMIFFPMLGFSDARYLGPSVPQPGAPPAEPHS